LSESEGVAPVDDGEFEFFPLSSEVWLGGLKYGLEVPVNQEPPWIREIKTV